MQPGMIGLGRMGANMVKCLMHAGHECVVFDRDARAVKVRVTEVAAGVADLDEFIAALAAARAIWLMVPAGVVAYVIDDLAGCLDVGDILIDAGNTYYRDDITRAASLRKRDIHYFDVGTSGGVRGPEAGEQLLQRDGRNWRTGEACRVEEK